MRSCMVALAAVLVPAIGCRHAGGHASGFSWSEPRILFGDAPVGRTVVVESRWQVNDRAIELIKVDATCDCTEAVLLDGGQEVRPGALPAHSKGAARISIRAKAPSAATTQSVLVRWRFAGEEQTHGSPLQMQGSFSKSYQVEPDLLVRSDLPPGQPCPLEVTWTSLRQDTKGAPGTVEPDPSIHVTSLTASRTKDGLLAIHLSGEVVPLSAWHRATTARLRLVGLEPAPPEVPIHVSWLPVVTINPAGVLELRGDAKEPHGASAVATLSFAPQVRAPDVLGTRIEPQDLSRCVSVGCERTPDGQFRLTVRGTFPNPTSWAEGSICVKGSTDMEEFRIPWMFLRPQEHPR